MRKIRILIADDHPLVRNGLRVLIDNHPDMALLGEAADGFEVLGKVRQHRPDVLLLDVAMPRMNGLEAARLVHNISPETRIVMFSMYEKEELARQALQAGAKGYVLKDADSSDVVKAIRAVYAGGYFFSSRVHAELIRSYLEEPGKPPSKGRHELLSEREREVFLLLVEGYSMAEIADLLCLSYKTVEKHRGGIVKKLGISNPVAMAKYAMRLGLIDCEIWQS